MTFVNARPDVMIVLARAYEYVGYNPPKPVTRPKKQLVGLGEVGEVHQEHAGLP